MMVKLSCTLILALCFFQSYGQQLEQLVEYIGNSDYVDVRSIEAGSNGNHIVLGYARSDFNINPLGDTILTGSVSEKFNWLASYNKSNGELEWFTRIDNTIGNSTFEVDSDGNILVLTELSSDTDLDIGPGEVNVQQLGNYSILLVKYRMDGSLLWHKVMHRATTLDINDLSLDASNNIYLTVQIRGSMDIDPGSGTVQVTSTDSNDQDDFLIAYTSNGNYRWHKHYRTLDPWYTSGWLKVYDDELHVVNLVERFIDFNPGGPGGGYAGTQYDPTTVYYVLDLEGNFKWSQGWRHSACSRNPSLKLDDTTFLIALQNNGLELNTQTSTAGVLYVTFDKDDKYIGVSELGNRDKINNSKVYPWKENKILTSFSYLSFPSVVDTNISNRDAMIGALSLSSGIFQPMLNLQSDESQIISDCIADECDIYLVGRVGDTTNMNPVYNPVWIEPSIGQFDRTNAAGFYTQYNLNSPLDLTELASCESIMYQGQTYENDTIFETKRVNKWDCDSTSRIVLDILENTIDSSTLEACIVHFWEGEILDSSGVYRKDYVNVDGCDSIIQLDLTIHESYNFNRTISVCGGFLWDVNNTAYFTDTMVSVTFPTIDGCDSTYNLNLEIFYPPIDTVTYSFCDSMMIFGDWYTESTSFYDTTRVELCEIIRLNYVEVSKSTSTDLVEVACDSFLFNNIWLKDSGIYADTLISSAGCDSVLLLSLTINEGVESEFEQSGCDEVEHEGQIYTRDTVLLFTTTNQMGCDSITRISIDVISSASPTIIEISGCDSVVVDGVSYYNSLVDEQVFPSSLGCDSIVITNATVFLSVEEEVMEVVCDTFVWPLNGQSYTESGIYQTTISTANGCDSTINLTLIIGGGETIISEITCDSFYWAINDEVYTESGQYVSTLTGGEGCDSIIILDLTIQSFFETTETITTCGEMYTWPRTKDVYTRSGLYLITLSGDQNCDSTFYLDLKLANTVDTIHVDTIGAYTWTETGETFEVSGIYTNELISIEGCDSIIVINLFIRKEEVETSVIWPNIINASNPGNNRFTIYGNNITSIKQLSIYDRWGNLVWQNKDMLAGDVSQAWNGKKDGQSVEQGIYIWMAEMEYGDNSKEVIYGDVMVLR